MLETARFLADTRFVPPHRVAAIGPKGWLVLAVSTLSHGTTTILYLIAVLLFLAGFFGFKPGTQRVRLDSLGLAVFVFVFFWNEWALT